MKKLLLALLLVPCLSFGQTVDVKGAKFTLKHGDLTFYVGADTASLVSVHEVTYDELTKIDGERNDRWHKETPNGPYNKNAYVKSGYDLGHLTPSNITSYDDVLNDHSFSFFNQAPQVAAFNRGKWAQLEKSVITDLLAAKSGAVVVTGVIYDVNSKKLPKSGIKIPVTFYKIVVTNKGNTCYVGSNINGQCTKVDLSVILDLIKKGSNPVTFDIKLGGK
jgi:DNA/RNA endonuclease G (NUC1)